MTRSSHYVWPELLELPTSQPYPPLPHIFDAKPAVPSLSEKNKKKLQERRATVEGPEMAAGPNNTNQSNPKASSVISMQLKELHAVPVPYTLTDSLVQLTLIKRPTHWWQVLFCRHGYTLQVTRTTPRCNHRHPLASKPGARLLHWVDSVLKNC